jgi:hypothetical protein
MEVFQKFHRKVAKSATDHKGICLSGIGDKIETVIGEGYTI